MKLWHAYAIVFLIAVVLYVGTIAFIQDIHLTIIESTVYIIGAIMIGAEKVVQAINKNKER